jgi:DNA-binding MarR family transcriptional regulator
MALPVSDLDDVVHQRTRLAILVILRPGGQVDFRSLRDDLGVTDGNLSQHLRVLADATYIVIKKGYEGLRPRTWLSITKTGIKALDHELGLLREVIIAGDRPVPVPRTTKRAGAKVAGAKVAGARAPSPELV